MSEPGRLSPLEQKILDFEGMWWKRRDAKAQAIKDHFDLSAVRYEQLVNALIDRPEALLYSPMTVRRLTRLRATRRGQRRTG